MSFRSRIACVVSVGAFALACLSQPLALDACAVSCEAALAARSATVAPPCHHTTPCATQISQAPSPGSAVTGAVAAPPPIVTLGITMRSAPALVPVTCVVQYSASPPPTQLRV